MAKKHDLLEVVGIRLLHRHNDLTDQEFMGEDYGDFEGKEALITKVLQLGEVENFSPASWILNNGELSVFEYSKDPNVKAALNKLKSNALFLSRFTNLLQEYDMQSLLALSILDRSWYAKHHGENLFLERSYEFDSPGGHMNVVLPENKEGDNSNHITTAWMLWQLEENCLGKQAPYTHACMPSFRCERFGDGTHRMTRTHLCG